MPKQVKAPSKAKSPVKPAQAIKKPAKKVASPKKSPTKKAAAVAASKPVEIVKHIHTFPNQGDYFSRNEKYRH